MLRKSTRVLSQLPLPASCGAKLNAPSSATNKYSSFVTRREHQTEPLLVKEKEAFAAIPKLTQIIGNYLTPENSKQTEHKKQKKFVYDINLSKRKSADASDASRAPSLGITEPDEKPHLDPGTFQTTQYHVLLSLKLIDGLMRKLHQRTPNKTISFAHGLPTSEIKNMFDYKMQVNIARCYLYLAVYCYERNLTARSTMCFKNTTMIIKMLLDSPITMECAETLFVPYIKLGADLGMINSVMTAAVHPTLSAASEVFSSYFYQRDPQVNKDCILQLLHDIGPYSLILKEIVMLLKSRHWLSTWRRADIVLLYSNVITVVHKCEKHAKFILRNNIVMNAEEKKIVANIVMAAKYASLTRAEDELVSGTEWPLESCTTIISAYKDLLSLTRDVAMVHEDMIDGVMQVFKILTMLLSYESINGLPASNLEAFKSTAYTGFRELIEQHHSKFLPLTDYVLASACEKFGNHKEASELFSRAAASLELALNDMKETDPVYLVFSTYLVYCYTSMARVKELMSFKADSNFSADHGADLIIQSHYCKAYDRVMKLIDKNDYLQSSSQTRAAWLAVYTFYQDKMYQYRHTVQQGRNDFPSNPSTRGLKQQNIIIGTEELVKALQEIKVFSAESNNLNQYIARSDSLQSDGLRKMMAKLFRHKIHHFKPELNVSKTDTPPSPNLIGTLLDALIIKAELYRGEPPKNLQDQIKRVTDQIQTTFTPKSPLLVETFTQLFELRKATGQSTPNTSYDAYLTKAAEKIASGIKFDYEKAKTQAVADFTDFVLQSLIST